MFVFLRAASVLMALSVCVSSLPAAKWPKYTDEEMFAKADFIVIGKIEEELPKTENDLHRGRLQVERTLLAEQGGGVRSMTVAYHGPESSKHIGIKPGVAGIWLLRRSMAGTSVIHPQQLRPLAEEEKILAGLTAWLPLAFEEQVAKVKRLRARDPGGNSSESLAASILMFRRSEQIRLLPGVDDSERQRDWIQRLQLMLAMYDRKMDFPAEAKTEVDKQQLMERLAKITGKELEPGTPLYERVVAQAPGMLAHVYGNLIQQTVAADDARFPDSIKRLSEDLKDADADRLKTRVSALQYLVDVANAGELQ